MNLELITSIIAMIEQMLPMLGTTEATVTMIDTIINTLSKILPLIVNWIPTVYQSIKNIITELKNDPATTDAQWEILATLDAQVDTAFEAAAKDVDPDAPSPAAP